MENRKEFYIPEYVMIGYNLGLVALSLYMLEEVSLSIYYFDYL